MDHVLIHLSLNTKLKPFSFFLELKCVKIRISSSSSFFNMTQNRFWETTG